MRNGNRWNSAAPPLSTYRSNEKRPAAISAPAAAPTSGGLWWSRL